MKTSALCWRYIIFSAVLFFFFLPVTPTSLCNVRCVWRISVPVDLILRIFLKFCQKWIRAQTECLVRWPWSWLFQVGVGQRNCNWSQWRMRSIDVFSLGIYGPTDILGVCAWFSGIFSSSRWGLWAHGWQFEHSSQWDNDLSKPMWLKGKKGENNDWITITNLSCLGVCECYCVFACVRKMSVL